MLILRILSAFVRKRIKQEMTIVLYRITTRNTGFAVLRIRVRVTQLYVEHFAGSLQTDADAMQGSG
jgi:hypothetical protein